MHRVGGQGSPESHSCQQWPPTERPRGQEKQGGSLSGRQRKLSTLLFITDSTKRKAVGLGEKREKERKARKAQGSSSARSCAVYSQGWSTGPRQQSGRIPGAAHLSELRFKGLAPAEAAFPSVAAPRSPPARHCPHCHTPPPQPARPGWVLPRGSPLRGPAPSSGEPCPTPVFIPSRAPSLASAHPLPPGSR